MAGADIDPGKCAGQNERSRLSVPAKFLKLNAWHPCLWLLLAAAGCSTAHYRKSADKEVGKVIAQKGAAVPNMDARFSIAQTNVLSLQGLPVWTNIPAFLGNESGMEQGAAI